MAVLLHLRRRIARRSGTSANGRRRLAFRLLLAAAAVLAAWPGKSWAIDVSEIRWGFDGRVTPQCFNLLSVLITNPAPFPFEGTLELHELIGGGTRVGAALAEDLYVAPSSSRWVQFYPYVKERYEEWSLQWGRRGGERADVPRPVLADQSPVLLVDADDPSSGGGAIRHFPENLFPPMVTATDSLKTVALDHVPRWEEARRQAFYDWLFRGGACTFSRTSTGRIPNFPRSWPNSTRRPSSFVSEMERFFGTIGSATGSIRN